MCSWPCQRAARAFYAGLLGLAEVPKPASLVRRGGCWFKNGEVRVHPGVETEFRPARKAHPALWSRTWRSCTRLAEAGIACRDDEPLEGRRRTHISDPFGNRIELMQAA